MPRPVRFFLSLFCTSGLLAATESKPIDIADFIRPLLFRAPAINFTGTRVAALSATADRRTALLIYDVGTRKAQVVRPDSARDVFRFAWLDDTNLIFNLARENRYASGLFVVNARQIDRRVNLNATDSVRFVGTPREHPLQPIVWIRRSSQTEGREDGLLQYDARQSFNANVAFSDDYYGPSNTGANVLQRLPAPSDVALGFTADRLGALAYAATSKDGVQAIWHWSGTRWEKCPLDLDEVDVAGSGGFGAELLLLGPRAGHHPRAVQRYDWHERKLGPSLVQDPRHDVMVDRVHQRDGNGEIVGLSYTTIGPKSIWFDEDLAALQVGIEKELPGSVVRCEGFNRMETQFLFQAFSDRHPGKFYLFDRQKNALTLIANSAPWIVPEQMRPTQLLQFTTQDGVELDGLLTLPARSTASPPPAIVIPADSPESPLCWGWDETTQWLVNRGYAVYRPNHRGATLYGWKTPKEVMWDFRRLHQDVTDGVKAVIRSGLIDGKRVAIMGEDFGAFLALCGAVYEPEMYRAAIGVAGTYDWAGAAKELGRDTHTIAEAGMVRRHLGDPSKATATYEAVSPLRQLAQIKAAFLVARGQDEEGPNDTQQSRRLVSALKSEHKTVEVVVAGGIDPAFSSMENRLKLDKAIEAFLAKQMASH